MKSSIEITRLASGDLSYLCGVTVSIQFEGEKEKYYCRCRGVSPSKFMILQTPAAFGIGTDLNEGTCLIVRYVYNGIVSGFKTWIIKAQNTPFRLIFTEYPEAIEQYRLRSSERVEVVIQAEYTMGDHTINAVIKDLSSGGCCLFVDASDRGELLAKGDEQVGILSFNTDLFNEILNILCKIVRIRADKNRTELGLQFDTSDTVMIDKITQYVDHILDIQA